MGPVHCGWASDTGRVRSVNEDSLLATATMFVVADGMGGHAAGDVASAIAVERLGQLGDGVRPEDLRRALEAANADILEAVDAQPEHAGMGTTVAGLCLTQVAGSEHWAVFNVGDSRVYRFADGRLAQVTVDHSEVAEMVAAGALTAEQAETYDRRHVLTRALGSDPAPVPDVWVFPPTGGERFLICSDGLSTELPDTQIADVLAGQDTPQRAALELVRRALLAGGRDNITAIVVEHAAEPANESLDDTVPRVRQTEPAP